MSALETTVLVHLIDELKQVEEICDLHFVNSTHLDFHKSTVLLKPADPLLVLNLTFRMKIKVCQS